MKIRLTVEWNDGTKKDVDAVFADFVAFERTWNRSVTKFEQELRLTDLAWLAWHSEKRNKQHTMQFDPDWIGTVATIGLTDDETEEPVPLDKNQPTG
jgi:hypothetical protein